jgi:hypothetical protein
METGFEGLGQDSALSILSLLLPTKAVRSTNIDRMNKERIDSQQL